MGAILRRNATVHFAVAKQFWNDNYIRSRAVATFSAIATALAGCMLCRPGIE